MAFSDHMRGNFLKAADLPAPRVRVTVSEFETQDVGMPKESKLVVFFAEFDHGLILNKTNLTQLKEMFGDDEAAACGQAIDLLVRQVEYNGQKMPAIRISAPAKVAARQVRPAPAPVPESDEDVPF